VTRGVLFPWPEVLFGLGRRRVGAFSKCSSCSTWTFVRYGETPTCLQCALRKEREPAA